MLNYRTRRAGSNRGCRGRRAEVCLFAEGGDELQPTSRAFAMMPLGPEPAEPEPRSKSGLGSSSGFAFDPASAEIVRVCRDAALPRRRGERFGPLGPGSANPKPNPSSGFQAPVLGRDARAQGFPQQASAELRTPGSGPGLGPRLAWSPGLGPSQVKAKICLFRLYKHTCRVAFITHVIFMTYTHIPMN